MTFHRLINEKATLDFGRRLAQYTDSLSVIFLEGDLGAGKTTLVRGLLKGMGHEGFVRSPTYTLVEPYMNTHKKPVYHFDLYRIKSPEELEFIGLRDYLMPQNLCIFEWPNYGEGELPLPDLLVRLSPQGEGRQAELLAHTEQGKFVLSQLEKHP